MIKKYILYCLLLSIGDGICAQTAYYEKMDHDLRDFPVNTAYCFWTDQAPVIDGDIQDACWKEAYVLDDFELTVGDHSLGSLIFQPGKKAKIQTRAMVLYDDRYLYIAFECMEPDMEGIRSETVKHDDENIVFDDRIEIFLDPDHDHINILNFKVNVDGTTLEQPYSRPIQYGWNYVTGDITWNTEWRARTLKYSDRWTGEVAIALDGVFNKPVSEGFTCGFNICRDRHAEKYFNKPQKIEYPHECSAWSYVYNPRGATVDNWYEPNMYGDLIFGESLIDIEKISFHESYATYTGEFWYVPQRWGDNPLKVRIRNLGDESLELLFEVKTKGFRGRELTREMRVLEPLKSGEIKLKIPIRADGSQSFTLYILDPKTRQLLYNTSYTTRVPPFIEFNLEAAYAPVDKTKGHIRFIPVTVPDALHDHYLTLELWMEGDEKPLAKEIVDKPGLLNEFTECFTDVDLSKLPSGDFYILSLLANSSGEIEAEFKQTFTRKTYTEEREFGASEKEYSFGGTRGKAIVVEFPDQKDFVFWEHAGYAPWWDAHNLGVCYQFLECWGYGNMGCNEPLQDRENRYSKVRILENNPARVVIQWTYALNDANYNIFLDEWADEYYTIYPDGTGIRSIHLWANSNLMHEIVQPQYVISPGVIPEQMFEDTVVQVFDLGDQMQVNELYMPASERPEYEMQNDWQEGIMRMNLKDRSQPFLVWSRREDLLPDFDAAFLTWQFPNSDVRYNLGAHWPVTDVPVDLYNIVSTDKPYHSWSGWIHVISDKGKQPNVWTHLLGSTTEDNDHLKDIAASWLYPAEVEILKGGFGFKEYDAEQMAYIFYKTGRQKNQGLKFRLTSDKREKIVNPVFVLKDVQNTMEVRLKLEGRELTPDGFRYTWLNDSDATQLLIWMDRVINKTSTIEIIIR